MKVNIFEVAEIERAVKGKIYPRGSSLIALSANGSCTESQYLKESGEVETRYAVVAPKCGFPPLFINISINRGLPRFLHQNQTGINLQFDQLRRLEIDVLSQDKMLEISEAARTIDKAIDAKEHLIENLETQKKIALKNLFM